jgi:Putative beta-barrel porin 2
MKTKALLALTGGLMTWGITLAQELQDFAAVAASRPLTYRAGQEFILDSNVLRLANGQPPPASYGSGDRGDTISRTYVGFTYSNVIANQNVKLDFNLDTRKHSNFSSLDRNTYGLVGSVGGNFDRSWYYSAGLDLSNSAGDFINQIGFEPNAVRGFGFNTRVGYRFTPTWSVYVAQNEANRTNSATSLRSADTDQSTVELGLRFEPGSAMNAEIGFSQRTVKFPNRQRFDALGNPLPLTISNNFQADQLIARVSYAPTAQSSFSGNLGFGNTRFDELTQRNSNNVLFGVDYRYAFSDVANFGVQFARDLGSSSSSFTSPVLSTRFGIRANWNPTGKVMVTGDVTTNNRRFTSDPSNFTTTNSLKEDRLRSMGIAAQYTLARTLNINLGISRQTRSANLSNFSYSGTLLNLGATMSFD